MSQYTSYYLYQKYEKRGEQDWLPCYPNIYSISGDSEIVMPLVMKSSADTACGYIPPSEPQYSWKAAPASDYMCSGTSKYYKEYFEVSYDSGQTWQHVVPEQTRRGDLIEAQSTDCGAIITYRWVNLDLSINHCCCGTTMCYMQQRQISYNGGQTWENVEPLEYQCGYSAQTQSEECGYVPPIYRWVNMDISSNWICDECTPIEPIYRWEAAPASDYMCSGTSKYYKEYFEVSHDSGQTWEHVVPEQTRRGDLIEAQSEDCGYVPPTPPSGYSNQYLTFVARENGTFKFSGTRISSLLYYSLDDGVTWVELASNTNSPTVTSGSKIMWKATLTPRTSSPYGIGTFSSTAKFDVEGNPMSLLFDDNFSGQTSLNGKSYSFYRIFSGNTNVVNAENMSLPATTLANNCYQYMFEGCTSLTTAPEILATSMSVSSCTRMFKDCTSLAIAPKLSATTLASYCYSCMFQGCTSLEEAPTVLPATTLSRECYSWMYKGCTSLTTAPELPATTLAQSCYEAMFLGCSGLTTAPELPATTLAQECYQEMFEGCHSLTTAPILSATTLADSCYYGMFGNCTSLTSVQSELPATTLANMCYLAMFMGCSGLTTAPELPATTLANYCYQSMFRDCWKLNYIKCLATDISAYECTWNWVYDVPSSGTFVKAASMTWPSGDSGIPSGWTVIDA